MDVNALKRKKAEALQAAEALHEKLDGDGLTADQRKEAELQADSYVALAKSLNDQLEGKLSAENIAMGRPAGERHPAGQRVAQPDPAGGYEAGRKPGAWRDAHGNRVAMLAHNERLTDFHGYSVDPGDFSAGETIRNYLIGDEGKPSVGAAHSGGSHTAGGFMLSRELSANVIDKARAASVVSQAGAVTVPMETSELSMVKVTTDPTVSWVGELETIPTTEAVFGRVTLRARKLGCIVPISVELVRDAPNAAGEIERLLSIAIAQEVDRAALLGDSDGEEPRGLFNHPDVTENAIGGVVDWDDFLDSMSVLETANAMPNALIYPPSVKKALAQLKVNSEANHYATPPRQLDDILKFTTTKLASSQAIMGDFTNLMIGNRSGLEIVVSDQATVSGDGFDNDAVLVKVRWRGDIQVARGDHFEKLTNIS